MSVLTEARSLAASLITEYGAVVTVNVPASSTTSSALVKTTTYTTYSAHAVFQGRVRERQADGSWSFADRLEALLAVENSLDLSLATTVGCTLTVSGTTYRMTRATAIAPDFATPVVYRVEYEL